MNRERKYTCKSIRIDEMKVTRYISSHNPFYDRQTVYKD
jgi:hypothetical protein